MSHLREVPASVIVIGAGATGVEVVSLFGDLKAEVTWIVDEYGILPGFDAEAGKSLRNSFADRGVRIAEPVTAGSIDSQEDAVLVQGSSGRSYRAATAFVAIGRSPDLSRLNLDAAQLESQAAGIPEIDSFGRTRKEWIYFVGDASGVPMLANRAMAQAWTAGRHAAGAEVEPFRPETIVRAVYSYPEVAEVGDLAGPYSVTVGYEKSLRARLSSHQGFLKLAYDENRKITGGVAVGPHAADMLVSVAVAIQSDMGIDELATVFSADPTLSELPFLAARTALM